MLLSIGALAGLVYGIIRGGSGAGWTTPGVLVPLVGGLLLLALFVWLQRRSTHPALDVSLFRNPAFSAAAGALGLNFFALLGATFYLVYYLQGVRGYTPLQSGAALIPVALGMALMAPRSSGLAERFGAKAVCASGFLLIALSFLGVQLLAPTSPVWLLLARPLGAGPRHGGGDGAGHRVDHERGAAREGRRGGRGEQLRPAGRRRPRRRDPRLGARGLLRRAPRPAVDALPAGCPGGCQAVDRRHARRRSRQVQAGGDERRRPRRRRPRRARPARPSSRPCTSPRCSPPGRPSSPPSSCWCWLPGRDADDRGSGAVTE